MLRKVFVVAFILSLLGINADLLARGGHGGRHHGGGGRHHGGGHHHNRHHHRGHYRGNWNPMWVAPVVAPVILNEDQPEDPNYYEDTPDQQQIQVEIN